MGQFAKPINIKTAVDNIHFRIYLLPSIQRKFIWESSRVEMLFDSILRGFPINSFMFWKITDSALKSQYKFYEFLKSYTERYNDCNPKIETKGLTDFYAIIDGQQRLTSLYIGLRGSYAYKTKNKKWVYNEENFPKRYLYLNIGKSLKKEIENQNIYDFRFLTEEEFQNRQNANDGSYWFKVGDILNCSKEKDVDTYLIKNNLCTNSYAKQTLHLLFKKICEEPLINYYLHDDQDPDMVLDVFLRANSGGKPLTFSALLMSMTTANWSLIDAREEFRYIIDQVANFGVPSFVITQDFILKTCLYLLSPNIKFKVKNFKISTIKNFEKNWDKIKSSIIATFDFLEKKGFNDNNFRAKNAAIPLIYYVYHKDLSNKITKHNYNAEDSEGITKWILLSFIKTIFNGQTDGILEKIRKVQKEYINKTNFPTDEIIKSFSTYSRDYSLSDDFLDEILTSQKDSSDAFYILRLLYPDLNYYSNVKSIHQDHLHPKVFFEKVSDRKLISYGIPKEDIEFVRDTWNTVANLQLLVGEINCSKKDKPLVDWVNKNHIQKKELYVDNQTSLELKDYKSFIQKRRLLIKERLKKLIGQF